MKFQRFFCHTLGVFDVFPITGTAGKVREPDGKTIVLLGQFVYDIRADACGARSKVSGDDDAAAFVRAQEKDFVKYA